MRTRMGLIAAVVVGCSTLAIGTAFAEASTSSDGLAAKDARITREVRQKLTQDVPDSKYQMSVSTIGDGVVVLSGRAETGFSEARALQDARKVPGVTAVEDRLRIVA